MEKVHYISYGIEQDEWRSRSDIVHINGASEESPAVNKKAMLMMKLPWHAPTPSV